MRKWCAQRFEHGVNIVMFFAGGLFVATVYVFICALCDSLAVVVDHSHSANEVRGLLCYSCNLKLSGLDDMNWRKKAEAYCAIC
jgi:recombination endonuclease VII